MRRIKSKTANGLFALFSGLCAVCVGVTSVAFQYKEYVDDFLGLQSSRVVTSDEDEDVDTLYYKSDFDDAADVVDFRNTHMEEVGEESAVLLKNENDALPLGTSAKVTMFGMSSYDPNYGSTNNPMGFTEAFAMSGIEVNPTMMSFYEGLNSTYDRTIPTGYTADATSGSFQTGEPPISEYDSQRETLEASYSEYSDAAIVVISREGSEGRDIQRDTDQWGDTYNSWPEDEDRPLALTNNERDMIAEAEEHFDKVIVLINSDNQIEIDELKEDENIDAIVWIGVPGSRGLIGVGRVLSGEANFSGHLPDTYAVDTTASPSYINSGDFTFSNADSITNEYGQTYVVYQEGIYVGYRYYETRYEDYVLGQGNADSATGSSTGEAWNYDDEVSYSFGYGLSYTDFKQEWVGSPEFVDDDIVFNVKVTNTGDTAGMDVVQIYLQSPYTTYDQETGLEKSAIQLLTFDKTVELDPGASTTVEISVPAKYMASYDVNGAGGSGCYVLEEGTYYFALGNGAHDALNNVLAEKEYSTSDGMDYDGDSTKVISWYNDSDDTETYSRGYDNTIIENKFDYADLNSFYDEDVVTYLSRSDWEGTWSGAIDDVTATDEMLPDLNGDTYEVDEDAGDVSSITVGAENDLMLLNLMGIDYDDPLWDDLLDELTYEELIDIVKSSGAVPQAIDSIGFQGLPVNGTQAVYDYPNGLNSTFRTDTSTIPYSVSSDSEYASYNFRTLASENNLAATFSPRLATQQGKVFGNDGLWSEQYGTWSAGLNIHRTAYAGRNYEYFSEDPMLTNILASDMIREAKEYGHIMMPKHLVLNDQEDNRQSTATFADEQTIREIYLRAFEGPMCPDEGGAMGVMTSFNRVGVRQASAISELVTDVLKEEWGFEGYCVTDMALDYIQYGRASITAGTDLMLNMFCEYADLSVDNISTDYNFLSSSREAAHRYLYVLVNSSGMNGFSVNTTLESITNWWQPVFIVVDVIFGILAIGAGAALIINMRKKRGGTNEETTTQEPKKAED